MARIKRNKEDRDRALRLREYVKSHSADQLYQRYVERKGGGIRAAEKEVTEVLKSVRVYEYYIAELEKKHKKELQELKGQISKLQQQLKQQQRSVQHIRESKGKDGVPELASASVKARTRSGGDLGAAVALPRPTKSKSERMDTLIGKLDKRFTQMQIEKDIPLRGDSRGKAVGDRTSADRDVYRWILEALQEHKYVHLTDNMKRSLAASPNFQERFQTFFANKLTPDEMEELWKANFTTKGDVFTSPYVEDPQSPRNKDKLINWVYEPRRKKS